MRSFAFAVACAMALTVSGCIAREAPGSRVVTYKLVSTETVTDPFTGDTTQFSHWQYDDGVTVTTEDRFKRDTPVEARRATSRPETRIVDIP